MPQDEWNNLVRRFVARGDKQSLLQAIQVTSESSRTQLLKATLNDDLKLVSKLATNLTNPSPSESATAEILVHHFYSTLCHDWRNASPADQTVLWDRGQRACERGAQLSSQLGDLDCEALFWGELASGWLSHNKPIKALPPAERAYQNYKYLSTTDMTEYGPDLANTLNIQGISFLQLKQFDSAQHKFENAMACYMQDSLSSYEERDSAIAVTYRNISDTHRALREYEAAKSSCSAALEIYEKLAPEGEKYRDPYIAVTCNALGLIHAMLHQWDTAWSYFERSLNAWRIWTQTQPPLSQLQIFNTLVNIGNTASQYQLLKTSEWEAQRPELNRSDSALSAYREALNLINQMISDKELLPGRELASILNNLGNELRNQKKSTEAVFYLNEAISLYRDLTIQLPEQRLELSISLFNHANALLELDEPELARADFTESLNIRVQLERWLDAAVCYEGIARVELASGQIKESTSQTETAIELLEKGMTELKESTHLDKFKGPLESAYLRLIDHYAASISTGDAAPLTRVLESCRAVESLVKLGFPEQNSFTEESLSNHRLKELFLWVHVTETQIVFSVVTDGWRQVLTAPLDLHQKLSTIAHLAEQISSQESLMQKLSTEGFSDWAQAKELNAQCATAYLLLPHALRERLEQCSPRIQLCLALCSRSVNLPWELLLAPASPQAFLGLSHTITRVHRMADINELWQRQPIGRRALVVGNPTRPDMINLSHTLESTLTLKQTLLNKGWITDVLTDQQATKLLILEGVKKEPALWTFSGHSSPFALFLANEESLDHSTIARLTLTNHPLIHLDSCFAGQTSAFGGRFSGHPTAALHAGASAVLSNSKKIYDKQAGTMFNLLYEYLLADTTHIELGEALLAARQQMHKIHGNNPLTWYSTVLWGNPHITL